MKKNKLNNQGFTLLELILTIILVSLIFLTAQRIMNQLMHVRNSPSLAYTNQTVRSLIIDTIQNDWLMHGLSFHGTNANNPNFSVPVMGTPAQCAPLAIPAASGNPARPATPCVIFTFRSFGRTATLAFSEFSLFYRSFDDISTTWQFTGARSHINAGWLGNVSSANPAHCNLSNAYHCFQTYNTPVIAGQPAGFNQYALIQIRIPIFNYRDNSQNNLGNNNINDDIVLTYFGRFRHFQQP